MFWEENSHIDLETSGGDYLFICLSTVETFMRSMEMVSTKKDVLGLFVAVCELI